MPQSKITATTGSEIVTVAEAKSFIRIDTSDDDTLLDNMIKQARIWSENYIGKDIVAKTRKYYLEQASSRFEIPFSPIASISSVTVEGVSSNYTTYGVALRARGVMMIRLLSCSFIGALLGQISVGFRGSHRPNNNW